MRITMFLSVLLIHFPALAQVAIPETHVNHAWIDGVYWNRGELPGWGFFVDAQEETLFGAIYGYNQGAPTFITLQGNLISDDPLRYQGDVFSVTNNGSTATDVGNFTWDVRFFEASPAAWLTISSNILNKSNLNLVRFSYVEEDKVDMFTAADWDIVTRVLGSSFADSFGISDDRFVEDDITYAAVFDNSDGDIGVVGYFPPSQGGFYAMGVEFDEDTLEFFVFYASDTEMFGRGWLLDQGEEPTGNGYYFHGAADTMQLTYQSMPLSQISSNNQPLEVSEPNFFDSSEVDKPNQSAKSHLEMETSEMFAPAAVSSAYQKLFAAYQSRIRDAAEVIAKE